jgi:uncharacterized repeat protein (TIGR01451 family)
MIFMKRALSLLFIFCLSALAVQAEHPTQMPECEVEGGDLTGGPFEFTVGDGMDDMITPGSITLSNNQGENSQWVVTDDEGYILGLPPMPSVVNFDGAGPGTCLVWHLSYDGAIDGLEMGLNANDLTGCYDLSNPISVVRTIEGDCQTNGGELFGGPFEFCVGDDIQDMVPAGSITLANSQGENSQWVITDDQGNILGLPPMPSVVNFDGAGAGTCLIWHLSYDGEIAGLEAGANAGDLEGCFDLSNPIEVVRNQPEGGTLTTTGGMTEKTICAGDGDTDAFDVILTDTEGTNSAWVITDADLNILALPPAPPFDLEGAGAGVCLIWHLSFEDGLEGATVGANAADLSGCFDLSNPITVTRLTGEECEVLNSVDLELSISSELSTYTQYENISYFITVTNNGYVTATNVVIAAGLPEGLVYTSDNPSEGSYNLFFEEWTIDELIEGASATLELKLFPLVDNVEVSNFVEVIAQDQADTDSAPGNGTGTPIEDDEALLLVGPENVDPTGGTDADLSVTLSVDAPSYQIYTNVTYTLTITNDGPDDASNVVVAAGLPEGMVYTSHSTGEGVYNLFFEEWQIPLLPSGATATLELVLFTLVGDQPINNFVEVIASDQDDADSTPGNGNGVSAQEDDEAAISVDPVSNLNNGGVQSFQAQSNVIAVQSLTLFPVPATDEINVRWTTDQKEVVEISVFDINGKVVHLEQVEAFKGSNTQAIDLQGFAEGMYFIQLLQNGAYQSQRFQKIVK